VVEGGPEADRLDAARFASSLVGDSLNSSFSVSLEVPPRAPYPPIAAARRPRQGHASDCAENGVEAVGACASQRYDLILMVSPGRDGGAAGGLGR
jgi:hypothetical protein